MARREVVAGAMLRLGIENPPMAEQIAAAFMGTRDAAICLFPDALPTLQRLRDLGVRLALITNGQERTSAPRSSGFPCGLVRVHPDRGRVRRSASRKNVCTGTRPANYSDRPAEVWMVGDNLEWDVAGAQRLGIAGIWHDVQGSGLPAGATVRPDRIIRSVRGVAGDSA